MSRYDAKEFLLARWRETHEKPRGTKASEFVRPMADVRGTCSRMCGDPLGSFASSLDLDRPLRGAVPFSRGDDK